MRLEIRLAMEKLGELAMQIQAAYTTARIQRLDDVTDSLRQALDVINERLEELEHNLCG